MDWKSTDEFETIVSFLEGSRQMRKGLDRMARGREKHTQLTQSSLSSTILLLGPPESGKKSLLSAVVRELNNLQHSKRATNCSTNPDDDDDKEKNNNSSSHHPTTTTRWQLYYPSMVDILSRRYQDGFSNGLEGYLRRVVAAAATASSSSVADVVPVIVFDQIQRWFSIPSSSKVFQIPGGATEDGGEAGGGGGFPSGGGEDAVPADDAVADLSFFIHTLRTNPLISHNKVAIVFTAPFSTTASSSSSTDIGDDEEDSGSDESLRAKLLAERWLFQECSITIEVSPPTYEARRCFFLASLTSSFTVLSSSAGAVGKPQQQLPETISEKLEMIASRAAAKSGGLPRGWVVEIAEELKIAAKRIISSSPSLSTAPLPPVSSVSSTFFKQFVDDCIGQVRLRRLGGAASVAVGSNSATAQAAGFVVDVTPTPWNAIIGLDEVKNTIRKKFALSEAKKKAFAKLGVAPTTGILLYGPPGTGKTMLAKAIATELEATFLTLSIADLVQGAVGESERILESLFVTAEQRAPSVIFFDELQAAFGRRDSSRVAGGTGGTSSTHDARLTSALLQGLDKLRQNYLTRSRQLRGAGGGVSAAPAVLVLGATNIPDHLDPALLGPGRLECHLKVPYPPPEARMKIIEREFSRVALHLEKTLLRPLAGTEVGKEAAGKEVPKHSSEVSDDITSLLLSKTDGNCCAADVVNLMNQYGLKVFAASLLVLKDKDKEEDSKQEELVGYSSNMNLKWDILTKAAETLPSMHKKVEDISKSNIGWNKKAGV